MPLASPSHDYVGDLVFGYGDSSSSSSHGSRDPEASTASNSAERSNERRQSMYVELFEEMLQTVVDTEPLLFNHDEYKAFGRYNTLHYRAKYLFIRLSLRKTDKWVRLSDLKYESEIGSDGIRQAITELCKDPCAGLLGVEAEDVKPNVQQPGPEVIDLTVDEEDEAQGKPGKAVQQDQPPKPGLEVFAQDESHATLHDLLECLRTEELKDLAKQMKVKPKGSNRDSFVDALLPTASTSSFPAVVSPTKGKGRGKTKSAGPPQRTLHGHIDPLKPSKKVTHQMTLHRFMKGGTSKTTQDRLRELVLQKIDTCIKLNEDVVSLFRRVNLVYFRSTVPTSLLTPSILARSKKWSYAHQPEVKARAPSEQAPPSSLASSSSSATLPSASTSTLGSLAGTPFTSPAPVPAAAKATEPSGSTGVPWARTQYKLWKTREDLIRYEWALELEARVDEIFGMAPTPGARRVAAPPSKKGKERERTGSVLSTLDRATPAVSVAGRSSVSVPPEKGRLSVISTASASGGRNEGRALSVVHEDVASDDSARVRGAKEVLKIFEEVYARWLEIPEVKEELERAEQEVKDVDIDAPKEAAEPTDGDVDISEEPKIKTEEAWDVFANLQAIAGVQPVGEPDGDDGAGDIATQGAESAMEEKWLNRFHYGHILTRIVCKGTHALSILKDHKLELEVLTKLLQQRAFRRGRRGRWHDRRALILMNYCAKDEQTTRHAWDCVLEALKDEDTHVVWRPMLCRRLARLQKTLRQFGVSESGFLRLDGIEQRKAPKVFIQGERIYATLDEAGNLIIPTKAVKTEAGSANKRRKVEKDDGKQMKLPFAPVAAAPVVKPLSVSPVKQKALTGKSIWRGRDDEEVNVETFALQHYESQGYKGLHSEGRIVTTLFGLLFWDIIFAEVPGAFETRYQMAPLDIAEDTFYLARRAIANARLKEIKDGRGLDVLCRTWDTHAEKKTFCVGVRWDLLQREDFVEIMGCLDGAGLSAICRTLVEDYGNRTGGLPDLFIWHPENKMAKFVEVKGPGDNLQENQKLWIEVLLQAKVPVEVCHVAEHDDKPKGKAKAKAKKSPAKKPKTQSASPSKKRKHVEDSDDPNDAILVESDGDVPLEVDYSQLDQEVVEESEAVSEAVDEPEPASEAVEEPEPTSEAFDEPEPVSDAVDVQAAAQASVDPESEPEPPRTQMQKMHTPEVTATPSPRRSMRPRKATNYDIVRRFDDILGPADEPWPVQRDTAKPPRAKSSPAKPKVAKKPRREPTVQEVKDAVPEASSQELKKTQEIVTRLDGDTDVEDEQIPVPRTPSRRTASRMQVEVVIETPSPARRKRKRDGSAT